MEIQNKAFTNRIIAAAIRVHKELGPGFLEGMYEEALTVELAAVGLLFEWQKLLPVFYHEHLVGEHRLDFLIEGKVILELKAISALEDIHFAIVRCEARWTRIPPNHQRRRSCPVIFLVSWIPN